MAMVVEGKKGWRLLNHGEVCHAPYLLTYLVGNWALANNVHLIID